MTTLNKTNTNNKHVPFFDLDICIINWKLNTIIYDKRYDFSFPIVNHPFSNGDISLSQSFGVYISQLFEILLFSFNAMHRLIMKNVFYKCSTFGK